jgi:phosphonate transport system permease protein
MHLEEIKKRTNPFSVYNIVIVCLILALFTWSWEATEMSVKSLIQGWHNMFIYVNGNPAIEGSGFFPPAVNLYSIKKYLLSMMETVQMALSPLPSR